MAATQQEILAQIGIDSRGVKTGLKTAEKEIKAWGSDIQREIGANGGASAVVFANSFKKSLNALKGLFALNVVSVASDALNYWDTLTKKIADAFTTRQSEGLENYRQAWHKAIEERDAQAKQAAQNEVERLKALKELRDARDTSTAAGYAEMIGKAGGENTEKGRSIRLQQLNYEKELADYAVFQAKAKGDALEIIKAETKQHQINLQLYEFENKKIDDQNKAKAGAIADRTAKMKAAAIGGKYDKTLSQIAALEAQAGVFMSRGDVGHANQLLRQSSAMRLGIKADLIESTKEKKTPQQTIMDQLIGSIQKNMENGRIPVTVEVKE